MMTFKRLASELAPFLQDLFSCEKIVDPDRPGRHLWLNEDLAGRYIGIMKAHGIIADTPGGFLTVQIPMERREYDLARAELVKLFGGREVWGHDSAGNMIACPVPVGYSLVVVHNWIACAAAGRWMGVSQTANITGPGVAQQAV